MPPLAHAATQILEQAVSEVRTLDQAKLAALIHAAAFDTAIGKVKFGKNGEWEVGRIFYVQYRNILPSELGNGNNQATPSWSGRLNSSPAISSIRIGAESSCLHPDMRRNPLRCLC